MKELVGKTVTSIQVNQDQSLLKFCTVDGEDIIYVAIGDCCSETWWADIVFSWGGWRESKYPFVVMAEETLEMPSWAEKVVNSDGKTRQEFDQIYGHKIKTQSGYLEVIYRNSSNGYYGGEYILLDNENKWQKQLLENAEWADINGDWSASSGHDGDDE